MMGIVGADTEDGLVRGARDAHYKAQMKSAKVCGDEHLILQPSADRFKGEDAIASGKVVFQ